MKLLVLAIGGTIDKVYFDALSDYQIGAPAAVEILQRVRANFDFEVRQMISKDSLEMTDADRQEILSVVKIWALLFLKQPKNVLKDILMMRKLQGQRSLWMDEIP